MFASLRESETSKMISNSFRMVHACICSMPLLIINLATTIDALRLDGREDYVIDIKSLHEHQSQVHMHGLAFALSFISFVRGACLFNERETMTLLFGLIALPMTVLTSLSRIFLLAIVITFVAPEWTAILLAGLVIANVILLWACRKGTKVIKGDLAQAKGSTLHTDDLNPPSMTCSNPGSHGCLSSCCCNPDAIQTVPSTKSGRYVVSTYSDSRTEQSCWNEMEKYLVLGFASIIVPSGYCNDVKSHHPRIKGGLFVILNYLVNMSIMGVTLGFTILHRVPNEFTGIVITNPAIMVNVPSSNLKIQTGIVDIKVNMPNQDLN